ncbi:MAG: RNase adapter RapZ [Acidimicrobiales bacterium]
MSEYLLVTGMSGAGRSTAAAALEDAGWYVIDNMPPALLSQAARVLGRAGSEHEQVALVMGRGGGTQVSELLPAISELRQSGARVRIVYLDAPLDVLVKRYEGSRRRHPLGGSGVQEAVGEERALLEPIRSEADVLIDTGELNVNQLRQRVLALFGDQDDDGMRSAVVSFGYKHGVPLDADLVFDCRFLPNPHWVEELRPYSGLDSPVRDYVMSQKQTAVFLDLVEQLLVTVLPSFVAEGKSYLTVAMGCTGGRHRSVVLAEQLAARLDNAGTYASVFHRDIDR